MWQKALTGAGGELKSGTVTGNGTQSITITLEDNAEDVIMFNMIKPSGSLTSAIFSVYFDKDNIFSIVSNSSAVSSYNANAVSVSRNGNTVTLTCSASYSFKLNVAYKYYYAI